MRVLCYFWYEVEHAEPQIRTMHFDVMPLVGDIVYREEKRPVFGRHKWRVSERAHGDRGFQITLVAA